MIQSTETSSGQLTSIGQDRTHPFECGFRLGLSVKVSPLGQIEERLWRPAAMDESDLVYVAIRSDGEVLKIGSTGGTLLSRWAGILRLSAAEPEQRQYRSSEWKARDRWREQTRGRAFEVWFKAAERGTLSNLDGQTQTVSLRHAEEDYLDAYYCPLIGISLDTRKRES